MAEARIPGTSWQRAADGDFPNESPDAWERMSATSWKRRYGKNGYSRVIPADTDQQRKDLDDLRDYLDHVAGAMWAALPDQKGDRENYNSVYLEAKTCTIACQRITETLNDEWTPRP